MINERIVIEEKTKDYNEAWIETYFWQESEELYPGQKRPVIVICPGGAYGMTSDREAEAIAVRFMGMGYHTVVLRYSVAPARYPVALRQLAKTVALLRENSDKWHIEKNKIIVSGFRQVAIWQLLWEYSGIRRSLPGSREWKTRGSVPMA